MNVKKIEQSLNQILRAANAIPVQGEENAAHIIVICRAAREVWEQVNAPEEKASAPAPDSTHDETMEK